MSETRSIVVERVMPYPPEKIWAQLTDSENMAAWLMPNDFEPVLGHKFTIRAKPAGDWNGISQCEVLAIEPPKRLAYRWKGGSVSNPDYGSALDSVVTWTLSEVPGGTLVRMEHAGFGPQNDFAYKAMGSGWSHIVANIEKRIEV